MARARKQDASSSAVRAKCGAYGVISRREDLNILNHQFSHGSAAETLQRKGTVEAFTCVGGSSWSGPPAVGLRGKFVWRLPVFSEWSAGSKLPVPSCCELLKLWFWWEVTEQEEEQLLAFSRGRKTQILTVLRVAD